MKAVRFLSMLLMVIGSLNWGLVGFFGYDLVADVFGGMMSTGARVIYALVGLAGLYGIGLICRCCKGCCKSCGSCGGSGNGSCGCGPHCNCNCHKK
jgi:uncharacterized membrane protein YuzA (DUF378 family)